MKALIYSPYFDTVGGGERYCLTVAEYFLEKNWQVDIFWDKLGPIKRIAQKLNLNVEKLKVTGKKPNALSWWQKFILTGKYDLVFWLSDGSIPFLFGRKNILHFQQPFIGVCKGNFLDRIKLKLIKKVVCNSRFTKKFIDKEYRLKSSVLYPPVDIEKFLPGKKENLIIAVGRFEQTKKQEILVETFKKMVDNGLAGWRFTLVGSSSVKNPFLENLMKQAAGYPIDFLPNAPFEKIRQIYAKAKIFWHAKGFKVEERRTPWLVEHFGIAPVEAMASGCVPLVVDKGGLKEIVRRRVGKRWGTSSQLRRMTMALINDEKKLSYFSRQGQLFSRRFSKDKFFNAIYNLI